ncbi:MAG: hypothetical protein ACYDA4_14090 [Ignavibacteriaceae bacterium]
MSDTFLRKDISYLYKKLANINSTKEQLIFLEQEKNDVERLFNCMNEKRISFFNYIVSRENFLRVVNCQEVFHVSVFINKVVKTANLRNKNPYGAFSFFFRNRIIDYVLYRKYYNYFIKLFGDYIKIIEKEISFCNEKLRLGFHIQGNEKYLDYLRRISKVKYGKNATLLKRINGNIIDFKKEEFALHTDKENKNEDFKVLFISPKVLIDELSKTANDMEKIILLLELKKDIKKVLLGLADINKKTLMVLRLKKMELLSNSPEALYYLEFQIAQHNKLCSEKIQLTVDHLYVHVKRKINELEKLCTIIKNEIKYLNKKRVIIQNLGESEKGEKNSESEKIKIDGETDPHNFNNNKQVDNRKVWRGTKGEFAVFVNEQYLDNQDRYGSLREAANYLFEKYRFKWGGWTKEMCYDYVKKK